MAVSDDHPEISLAKLTIIEATITVPPPVSNSDGPLPGSQECMRVITDALSYAYSTRDVLCRGSISECHYPRTPPIPISDATARNPDIRSVVTVKIYYRIKSALGTSRRFRMAPKSNLGV